MKIRQMRTEDKLCFITLLCLASSADEGGLVRNCDEEQLINLTGLYYNPYESENEYTRAQGCLKRYEALRSVTLHDNGDVTVNAFALRQEENLSNAERQKRYRERLKSKVFDRNKDGVTLRNDSNARIEENRIDTSEPNGSHSDKPLNSKNKDMDWNKRSDDDSDLPAVDIDGDGELKTPEKAQTKKYPNAPAIRKIFLEVLGLNPANWKVNKNQLIACENLFTERTPEKVRSALEFYKEHEDEEFCPKIHSPYDLDSKWTKLGEFKLKQ